MEKQNLYLILIVGIVGLVAIIAMITATTSSTTSEYSTITGHVVAAPSDVSPPTIQSVVQGTECKSTSNDTHGACVNGYFARCGDGYLFIGVEQCEVTTMNGKSCESFGYAGGTLKCTDCVFDTSDCTN